MKVQRWQLEQRKAQPLEIKIRMTQNRIRAWCDYWDGDVYVAFSGGKDSTVLLDIVRKIYPEVPAVFVNTGLQYPEVRKFALDQENVVELRPKTGFREVVKKHSWPVVSKKVSNMMRKLQRPTERNVASRHLYLTGYTLDGRHCPDFKLSKNLLVIYHNGFLSSINISN